MPNSTTCRFPGCVNAYRSKGLCISHYSQQWLGNPLTPIGSPKVSAVERFWSKVDKSGPCWLWLGTITHNGYGIINMQGSTRRAHRYAWEMANGPIPDGQIIDHVCHTRNCVNVDHMRIATYKHNMENRKGANKNSSTGVRGVTRYRDTGRWRGVVKHDRHSYHVGIFDTIEEAEAAVIAKRAELFAHNDRDRAA